MTETIDATQIPPRARHETIFGRLDELSAGEALRVSVDHDPTPLLLQLEHTRPRRFVWSWVEQGPERWVVEIVSKAHVVDARPIIASGGEPFDTIMAAVERVQDGEVLVVYAPFEPVPLEGVLAERGFDHDARQIGDGDWCVTFFRM